MQMRASLLDDRVKRRRIGDRQFAEHLAIERDAGEVQGGNEPVVRDAALLEGSVQADDPAFGNAASSACGRGSRMRRPGG